MNYALIFINIELVIDSHGWDIVKKGTATALKIIGWTLIVIGFMLWTIIAIFLFWLSNVNSAKPEVYSELVLAFVRSVFFGLIICGVGFIIRWRANKSLKPYFDHL